MCSFLNRDVITGYRRYPPEENIISEKQRSVYHTKTMYGLEYSPYSYFLVIFICPFSGHYKLALYEMSCLNYS